MYTLLHGIPAMAETQGRWAVELLETGSKPGHNVLFSLSRNLGG